MAPDRARKSAASFPAMPLCPGTWVYNEKPRARKSKQISCGNNLQVEVTGEKSGILGKRTESQDKPSPRIHGNDRYRYHVMIHK